MRLFGSTSFANDTWRCICTGDNVTIIEFRLLKKGARLISINEGRYHKTETGLSLGPGCFVKGLEFAADCRAHLIGKPSENFFISALGDTSPSEAVMIGDVSHRFNFPPPHFHNSLLIYCEY